MAEKGTDMSGFQRASKKQAKLRLALVGPSGAGKTMSALKIGSHLGKKMAVIDTERGSASLYAWNPDNGPAPEGQFVFDVQELTSFHPQQYIDRINEAEQAGYEVLVIDGLSHAWMGKDGELQLKEKAESRPGENSWTAWRLVTPLHHALVDAILGSRMHIIATMRAKTVWELEEYTDRNGQKKKKPVKIGLAPIMRDGIEFEFTVTGDLTPDHELIISKTRCPALDGLTFSKPGAQVAEILNAWLSDGTPPPPGPSVELVTEIDGLLGLINGGAEPARSHVEKLYGTRDVSRLTEAQATELRNRLAARAAEDAGQETIFKAPGEKPRGRKPNPEIGK